MSAANLYWCERSITSPLGSCIFGARPRAVVQRINGRAQVELATLACVQKQIRESVFLRRSKAKFSGQNDPDPFILQDCSRCQGSGRVCEHYTRADGAEVRALQNCSDCDRTGTTGQLERYFLNGGPEVKVVVGPNSWINCPNCGWRSQLVTAIVGQGDGTSVWTEDQNHQ